MTLEWQVSSPPPMFNFAETPRVVGGPYQYGEPGAKHAIMTTSRNPTVDGGARMSAHAEALGHGHDEHPGAAAREPQLADGPERGRHGHLHRLGGELFGSFFAAYGYVRIVNPEFPRVAAGAVRAAGGRDVDEHRDPRLLELHGDTGRRGRSSATSAGASWPASS